MASPYKLESSKQFKLQHNKATHFSRNQTRDVYSFASNRKTQLPPHQHRSLRFWIPTSDKMGKLIELAKDKRKKAIDFFFFFFLHFQ